MIKEPILLQYIFSTKIVIVIFIWKCLRTKMGNIIKRNWQKISNSGVSADYDNYQKKRIVLSNQLSILLSIVLLIISAIQTFKLQLYFSSILFSVVAIFLLLIPILNKAGKTKLTRIVLSNIPPLFILLVASYGKIMQPSSKELIYYFAPRFLILGTIVLPLILIDIREKVSLIFSLFINLFALLFYDKLHEILGVGKAEMIIGFDNYIVINPISFLSFILIVGGFVFLQNINLKYENEISELLSKLRSTNKDLNTKKNKLIETNKELVSAEEELRQYTDEISATNDSLINSFSDISTKNEELVAKEEELRQHTDELSATTDSLINAYSEISTKNEELEKHKLIILKQSEDLNETNTKLEERQEMIVLKSSELEETNILLRTEKNKVERKNEEVKAALRYARTIQNVLLDDIDLLKKYWDTFVFQQPKDIVSGDFFWYYTIQQNQNKYITFAAAVDCTGHGVSGAFLSLIGNSSLNEIVQKRKIYEPSKILTTLDNLLKTRMKQNSTHIDDGMDICLVSLELLDNKKIKLTFSGAKRPLYIYYNKDKKVVRIKGVNKSIGAMYHDDIHYVSNEFILSKNDSLYLSSDGYIDQHNSKRKKIGSAGFANILNEIGELTTEKQKDLIEKNLEEHKKDNIQRDDILVLGIKL